MQKKNIFITTPIYYVNSSPHIGHAYTNMIASVIKRWFSMNENETMLLTGTDEHGQKIEEAAKKEGLEIKNFIDHYSSEFKDLAKNLNMPFDDFIRTSEERHKEGVIYLWNQLLQKGYIYLDKYCGWYAPRDEAFYKESEIENGKAPTGADVFWHEEESYFFKLSKFEEKLLKFYKDNPEFIKPKNRSQEVIKFVESGLDDLCISRKNFKHGIPVPNNPEHTIYVWIDALANYITALGFHDENNNSKFKKFWPQGSGGKENLALHVIGKDIVRFHAIYWPAILMACEIKLPSHLLVHGWWLKNGEKISKSLGNTIDPNELIEKFGSDYVSYFFLSEISLESDGDYSEEKFINKINSELVNNIGNLISRATNMISIYFEGDVKFDKENTMYIEEYELKIQNFWKNFSLLMDEFKFNQAISEILSFSSSINLLINDYKPWKILSEKNDQSSKENLDSKKMIENIFYICMQAIKTILIALQAFIPKKSEEILSMIIDLSKPFEQNLMKEIFENNNFKKIHKINVFQKI